MKRIFILICLLTIISFPSTSRADSFLGTVYTDEYQYKLYNAYLGSYDYKIVYGKGTSSNIVSIVFNPSGNWVTNSAYSQQIQYYKYTLDGTTFINSYKTTHLYLDNVTSIVSNTDFAIVSVNDGNGNYAVNKYVNYLNGGSDEGFNIEGNIPSFIGEGIFDSLLDINVDGLINDCLYQIETEGIAFALGYVPYAGPYLAGAWEVAVFVPPTSNYIYDSFSSLNSQIFDLDLNSGFKKMGVFVKTSSIEFTSDNITKTVPKTSSNIGIAIRQAGYDGETNTWHYGSWTTINNITSSSVGDAIYNNYENVTVNNVSYPVNLSEVTINNISEDNSVNTSNQYVYTTIVEGDNIENQTINEIKNNTPVSVTINKLGIGSGSDFFKGILSSVNLVSLLSSLAALIMAILFLIPHVIGSMTFLPPYCGILLSIAVFVLLILGCIRAVTGLINNIGGSDDS